MKKNSKILNISLELYIVSLGSAAGRVHTFTRCLRRVKQHCQYEYFSSFSAPRGCIWLSQVRIIKQDRRGK